MAALPVHQSAPSHRKLIFDPMYRRSCVAHSLQHTLRCEPAFQTIQSLKRAPGRSQVVACYGQPKGTPTQLWALGAVGACVAFELLAQSPVSALALDTTPLSLPTDQYASTVANRQKAPQATASGDESTEDVYESHKDMFTKDAWLGMQRIIRYGRYVDTLEDIENAPGCEKCRANRMVLEHAWQVVANEYFDPKSNFSQTWWAGELERVLKDHGGAMHTKHDLYVVARAMISGLGDKYSEFLDPAAFRAAIRRPTQAELDYLSSQAVGVGMKMGDVANGTGRKVSATLSGSQAEAAGLRIGDVVMSVDGIPSSHLDTQALRSFLRGPVGSSVDLVVHKADSVSKSSTESITLYRQPLPQAPVVHTVLSQPNIPGSAVEYVRINYFSSDATAEVMKAILQGETLGVDGYILDLRNNPGGVFEEAVAIASFLLDSSDPTGMDTSSYPAIVETVRNIDPTSKRDVVDNIFKVGMLPQSMPANAWGLTNRPIVILTNNGTASASEVLTGALQDMQDNQRAYVVGEKTFGKGVIQFFFPMQDGSGLKLTVAKYLTPNYHDISMSGGIEPDAVCRDHPRGLLPGPSDQYDDCVLQALKYLDSHPMLEAPALQASL